MQPEATGSRNYNAWLLAGLTAYGAINVVGVALAATGVVHPPWGILTFFTFVGPALVIVGVGGVQAFSDKRPFTWAAVVGVILAMLVAAYLNLLALFSASAAV